MKFSKLSSLVPFFNDFQLERIIVDTVKEKDLQVCYSKCYLLRSSDLQLHEQFVGFGISASNF